MSELKPCPFCGGEAKIVHRGSWWRVGCKTRNKDGCIGRSYMSRAFDTEEQAIAAWNTRYHSEFEETVIKAWEEIKNYTERTCEAEYRSGGYGIGGWYCLACGDYMHDDLQQDMAYCPNCGAKVVEQ